MAGGHGSGRTAPPADVGGACPRSLRSRDVRPCPPSRDAPIEAPPLPKSFAEPLLPLPLAQEHGVAASDIKKLLEAGIHTVEGLAYASKKHLKDIKGLSEMKVEKLKMAGESQTWHPFQIFLQDPS